MERLETSSYRETWTRIYGFQDFKGRDRWKIPYVRTYARYRFYKSDIRRGKRRGIRIRNKEKGGGKWSRKVRDIGRKESGEKKERRKGRKGGREGGREEREEKKLLRKCERKEEYRM